MSKFELDTKAAMNSQLRGTVAYLAKKQGVVLSIEKIKVSAEVTGKTVTLIVKL